MSLRVLALVPLWHVPANPVVLHYCGWVLSCYLEPLFAVGDVLGNHFDDKL
jgi:hypothetical protein